jgi:hypothetical protein
MLKEIGIMPFDDAKFSGDATPLSCLAIPCFSASTLSAPQ